MSLLPTEDGDCDPLDDDVPVRNEEIYKYLALFMKADEDTPTSTSDTRYVILTIDAATISGTSFSTDDFITAQQNDLACQNFAKTVGLP